MYKKPTIKKDKVKDVRGPVADMNIIVKDTKNVEWYSKLTKEQFTKHCKDDYSVQVYDQAGQPAKKYLRGYLTFVSEFETVLKNIPKKAPTAIIDSVMNDIQDIDPEEVEQALALAHESDIVIAVNPDGEITQEEDTSDEAPQEALLKEDQLHLVEEKDVME
jgi:hypothetical protein